MSWLPEHIDWTVPCYWAAIVVGATVGAWWIDKQGPTPRI